MATHIYKYIVNVQRIIFNTRDAYDLECLSYKELKSNIISEFYQNQINIKRCFSLMYEYTQIFRFDRTKINWRFFSAIHQAESVNTSESISNWNQFLGEFGAFSRQCNAENNYNIVDLLTYNTFPSLFGLLSDLEISDSIDIEKEVKSTIPNFQLFTCFLLKEFFFYKEIKQTLISGKKVINVPLHDRIETFLRFSRSVFITPSFLYFVHTVFAPIILKFRSYYSDIETSEKGSNVLIENTTSCLFEKLLEAFKENIEKCPSEISHFFKALNLGIKLFNQIENVENGDKVALTCTSYVFYVNFIRLLFIDPLHFCIIGFHQNNSLFERDELFEGKLKEVSQRFVEVLLQSVDDEVDFSYIKKLYRKSDEGQIEGEFIQPKPKFIIIDQYDKKILEIFKSQKKDLSQFNDCFNQSYSIDQYQLFKVNLKSDSQKVENKKQPQNEKEHKKQQHDNDNDEEDESEDFDTNDGDLSTSFNGIIGNHDDLAYIQMCISLKNLISVAPPLPMKSEFKVDCDKNTSYPELFKRVIEKALYRDILSIRNADARKDYFNSFTSNYHKFPSNPSQLEKLFEFVLERSNPNSRLIPQSPEKELKIFSISKQNLRDRIDINREKKTINEVLKHQAAVLYVKLFSVFLMMTHDTNSELIKMKSEMVKKLTFFQNYLNDKSFPSETPSAVTLSSDIEQTKEFFTYIQKVHSLFVKEVGNFQYANEVIHSYFFKNLNYYSFLITRPHLIAKDMALSARFVTCDMKSKRESQNSTFEYNTFVLPNEVISNIELISEPRKMLSNALSENEVPFNKTMLLSKAFQEVSKTFDLNIDKGDSLIEVIAYIIATLHCAHFASAYEFVSDFVSDFYEIIGKELSDFFLILNKVSSRLNGKVIENNFSGSLGSSSHSVEIENLNQNNLY